MSWRLATLRNGFQEDAAYRVEFFLSIFSSAIVPAGWKIPSAMCGTSQPTEGTASQEKLGSTPTGAQALTVDVDVAFVIDHAGAAVQAHAGAHESPAPGTARRAQRHSIRTFAPSLDSATPLAGGPPAAS